MIGILVNNPSPFENCATVWFAIPTFNRMTEKYMTKKTCIENMMVFCGVGEEITGTPHKLVETTIAEVEPETKPEMEPYVAPLYFCFEDALAESCPDGQIKVADALRVFEVKCFDDINELSRWLGLDINVKLTSETAPFWLEKNADHVERVMKLALEIIEVLTNTTRYPEAEACIKEDRDAVEDLIRERKYTRK